MTIRRSYNHYFSGPISFRNRTILRANTPVDDEVFSSLEYVSEIKNNGLELILNRGISNPDKVFNQFQAFIRQGKAFYYAAKELHFRASALLYYYSFMNLVKAKISIIDPNFLSGKVRHGLTHAHGKFSPLPISKQYIEVRGGIFPKFYKTEIGKIIPNKKKLNIINLIAYCSDVQHEFQRAGFGESKILGVKSIKLADDKTKTTWPIIAIDNFNRIERYKKTLTSFYTYFDEVELGQNDVRDIFEVSEFEAEFYTYFQSKKTYKYLSGDQDVSDTLKQDVIDALNGIYESKIYNDEFDFKLCIPLRLNDQTQFNQALSIYSIIWFIGSLVRYNPDYLESIIQSKEAWIIDRFVMGAPITFLRYIANSILSEDFIYIKR